MTTQRILVTGATGFVGRHVVSHLVAQDKDLLLVVRDIGRCPVEWRNEPRITVTEIADMTSVSELSGTMAGADTVVHLAGLAHIAAGDRSDREEQFMLANAQGTSALCEATLSSNIATFIHLSSLAAITGNSTPETIGDRTNSEPVTAYGRSKREAERHVRRLAEAGAFAVSLRPPLVVGADARGNWASLQALAATGLPLPFAGIGNCRSFISVRTLAEAIAVLCDGDKPITASGNYCLADLPPISLPDLMRELRAGMGMQARLFSCPSAFFDMLGTITGRRRQIAGLTGDLRVDASRFYDTFGFHPSQGLPEAIRQSGKEYMKRRRHLG
ncbi:NAD-dependent epimerase/dehydratase family protein [Pseudaminobacter salicylatoxidans]|uniref:NAD-dependent epimerase/dehydratase family protein n=1 Tax=Pseudaminobacter salicylatoxidans TaxID=93369 RepID=UPI00037AF50A|nr:NAD-dependent epimerase/dehydratase family protein [Pseudaminobacter salicylatoxidans]